MSELSPNERVKAWEDLEQNNAWMELKDTLNAQIKSREMEILHGALTPENLYDREKLRGERAGLELVLRLAESLHELALQDVELQRQNSPKEKQNV